MPSAPHERGHESHLRGISYEKVCVPCAVNHNGMSIAKITNIGRVSTKDLHRLYDGRIQKDTVLITDKMNSYTRFSNKNDLQLVQLKIGKTKKGIYNQIGTILLINSYHSQLKRFLHQFKGVSTKYLNNYLVWNNFVNYAKETDAEKKNSFIAFVLTIGKTIRNKDIPRCSPVPVQYKKVLKISHLIIHSLLLNM